MSETESDSKVRLLKLLKLTFFFLWIWGLNSGLYSCRADALPLPHLQTIFLWLFWRWDSLKLFAWAGLKPKSSQS
jgi:hypothetical protein